MQPLSALFVKGGIMSKQLKSRPLSNAKIQSILAQNPSMKTNTTSTFPNPIQPSVPQIITLKRSEEFDSLHPEEKLREFLSFARDVISRYEENVRLQTELETETQDLLHYVELSDNMDACKGNKMYKKVREVRRKRRACKNEIDLLKPLYEYLSDKTLINQLSKIQGQCRTSKETISSRQYTLRTDVIQ